MSTLPPPNFQFNPGPPVPAPPIAPTPAPVRSPRMLMAGLVAVAVVAGGVTYLATRSNDGGAAPAVTTTVTVPSTLAITVPPSLPPSTPPPSTPPPSTLPPTIPETTPPTVVVPPGATELRDGVFVPAEAGVEVTGDDPYTFSNPTTNVSVILQALERGPSEDPNVVLQEYVDTFDSDYQLVTYTNTTTFDPGFQGHDNLRFSEVSYEIYRSDQTTKNISGKVWAIVRNDGLTVLGDVYDDGVAGAAISDATFNAIVDSLAAAPAVGATGAWYPTKTMMPKTAQNTAPLPFPSERTLTLAPGYSVVSQSSSSVTASDGNDSMTIARLTGVSSLEDAKGVATQALQALVPGATCSDLVDNGADQALPDLSCGWNGTSSGGAALSGGLWLRYDSATRNMIVAVGSHLTTDWDRNAEVLMVDSVFWLTSTIA